MRQIKFRAWSEYEKKMIYDANSDIKIYLNGAISKDGNWETSWLKIMQFIGAYDKNGKEIYEGDIVKMSWQHDGVTNYDYEYIGEVIFDQNDAQFKYRKEEKGVVTSYPMYSFEREELDFGSIEVIGNIYENPELLKTS